MTSHTLTPTVEDTLLDAEYSIHETLELSTRNKAGIMLAESLYHAWDDGEGEMVEALQAGDTARAIVFVTERAQRTGLISAELAELLLEAYE